MYAVGYASALADRHVGKALQVIHERPGNKWTVDALASRAGQSRSVFAERFQKLVGLSPMQYLTRWRMRQAHEWLATGGESVSQVAMRCGY
jgi:AraC-like DNA-binding protein